MPSTRSKLLSAALGFSLVLAGSAPAFAQEDEATMDEDTEEVTMTTGSSSFPNSAAGAFGQPGDRSASTGMGHATDSSNNWMGDVAEGLSNQPMNDDSDSPDTSQGSI